MNKLELIVVMIKLFLGGMQFVAIKALSQTWTFNIDGVKAKYNRSFFVAFILFASVLFAFVPYVYVKRKNPTTVSSITPKSMLKVSFSGTCDTIAQICTIL